MPGTRDIAVNKTDKVSAFRKLPSGRRGIISKKTYNVESTMKKKKLSKVLERGWWGDGAGKGLISTGIPFRKIKIL